MKWRKLLRAAEAIRGDAQVEVLRPSETAVEQDGVQVRILPIIITSVQILNKGDHMEKRRLSVDISEDDFMRMHNLIPWGITGRLVRMLFLQVLDMIEAHGIIVLGAIMSGELTALDILVKGGKNGLNRSKE